MEREIGSYDREWRVAAQKQIEEQGKTIGELKLAIALLSQRDEEKKEKLKEMAPIIDQMRTFMASARGAQTVLYAFSAIFGAGVTWVIDWVRGSH